MRTLITLAVTLLCATAAYASDYPTLAGLKGVWPDVTVETSPPGMKGVDKDDIERDVELQLRRAGVPLLSASEAQVFGGWLDVSVLVQTRESKIPGDFAFAVIVRLNQMMAPRNNPNPDLRVMASNWSEVALGGGEIASLRRHIREHIDSFAKDYFEANSPK